MGALKFVGGARRDKRTATTERSGRDGDEIGASEKAKKTEVRGSRTVPLILHQSVPVFHSGQTPNLVWLVNRTDETHWTEVLEQLKAVNSQIC